MNTQTNQQLPKIQHSLTRKLFAHVSLLIGVTVLLMSVTAFVVSRTELENRTVNQLLGFASAKEDLLESMLAQQKQEVSLMTRNIDQITSSDVAEMDHVLFAYIQTDTGSTIIESGSLLYAGLQSYIDAHIRTDQTVIIPIVTRDEGLISYAVAAPSGAKNDNAHFIVLFDARPLLQQVLDTRHLAETFDVSISIKEGDELLIVRAPESNDLPAPYYASSYKEALDAQSPFADALAGAEGAGKGKDFAGVSVYTGYRYVPSIGWGIVVSIDTADVLSPLQRTAIAMFGAGLVLILWSLLASWRLATRITAPLRELTRKFLQLETKHWLFSRSIHTGDEIEVVDAAAFALAERLRDSYEHLEEKVAMRTKELSEANAQDEAILASMDHGVILTDEKGRIVKMNGAAATLTGWRVQDAVGQEVADVLVLLDKNQDPVDKSAHPVQHALNTCTLYSPFPDPGLILVQRDSEERPVVMIASPIKRGRNCLGTVIVFRDVTEERRIDSMKSEFIALASHQLRTPISSIRWNSEILMESKTLTDEEKDSAEEVRRSTERMARLIDSLLNVANLELGKISVNMQESVDLQLFFSNVLEIFAADMQKKNITLNTDVQLPDDISVQTDLILLRLIIENIIGNAIKYSPENSTVTLAVSASEKKDALLISITDQGMGIPSTEQSRIFQKLFRATNARESDTDGSGLGLYIARMAAEAIGGQIWFESGDKNGTTFFVQLPLKQ